MPLLAHCRQRCSRVALWGALVMLVACAREQTVTLMNNSKTLSLTYLCAEEGPRALDTTMVALVRSVILREGAERIIARAEESTEAREVKRAYESGQLVAIEEAVARYTCTYGNPGARPPRFPERGSASPDFVLRRLGEDGRVAADSVRLSELLGRPVLLVFWGSWCGPCRDEYPELVSLAREFSRQGLALYVIGFNESSRQTASWIKANGGMQLPFLVDADGEVARRFKVHGAPWMFLLDTDGRVLDACAGCAYGPMSPDSLRVRLNRLLSG